VLTALPNKPCSKQSKAMEEEAVKEHQEKRSAERNVAEMQK